ncbi:MAG: glycosyltransferase family 4 protein [Promethearchaeota archaeon]
MKNRALIYTEANSFGGSEQYVLYLIDTLFKKFSLYLVYTGSPIYKPFEKYKTKLTSVHCWNNSFPPITTEHESFKGDCGFTYWIDDLFKRIMPHIVIANNGGYPWNFSTFLALKSAQENRITRRILIPHSTPDNIFNIGGIQIDALVNECCTDVIIGSNALRKKYLNERHMLLNKLLKVCEYGVPEVTFYNERKNNSNKITIGFLGSMRNLRKGQIEILKTAKKLCDLGKNINFIFAGEGQEINTLREYIGANDLKNVALVGQVSGEAKRKFFKAIDIFILPSQQEGLSLALIEALSAGVAIIASNVGGIADAVQHEINGILLDHVSPETIFDAISLYEKDSEFLFQCGKNSRKLYEDTFSFERFKERFLKIILGMDK